MTSMLCNPGIPILAAEDPLAHIVPHKVGEIAGIEITNLHVMALVVAVLGLLCFGLLAKRARTEPHKGVEGYITKGRFAQLLEVICQYIRDNVARPNLGELTDKYIYYIWSVFFFVLIANLIGMVPLGAIAALVTGLVTGDWEGEAVQYAAHFGGTITANLMVTGALALLSFFMILGVGVREQGSKYFAHFAPVPLWPIMPGGSLPMFPLALFLVVLELLGLVIKCTVLAVRLFGNLMAGHLVIAAVMFLIITYGTVSAVLGYGVGVVVILGLTALSLLELFVAFLQAFIFTFLTVLFIAQGAVHHGEHGHEHEEHGHDAHVSGGAAAH